MGAGVEWDPMDRPRFECRIDLPDWIASAVDWEQRRRTDAEQVALAIDLARGNAVNGTGGPFGAAVFVEGSGELVAVGVNGVVRLGNSSLHAEIVALALAQARIGSYTLRRPGLPGHVLAASCDPCAMCLGAALWSGAARLVCGASRDDAQAIGFEEGPVFSESYRYLEARGLTIARGILRAEAREVLDLYRARGAPIYNG